MTAVHVVVPDGIDDPSRPTGGNTYDRHVCRHLGSAGWSVHEHAVPGLWPHRDGDSIAALAGVMERIPDRAPVLLDGLIASTAPEVLVPEARRLHLVTLVHMPLGDRPADAAAVDIRRREGMVLWAAAAVVTTSHWSRKRLQELYRLPPGRVHVATPGVEAADLAPGSAAGRGLLCVAAVTFEKGHDVLLDALQTMSDLPWRCVCVGSLDRAPKFVSGLLPRTLDGGLRNRVWFAGPQSGAELDRSYAAADLMVMASRAETYGMVVTEALARGLPVVAAGVGGVPEAMGYAADRNRPGLLVSPEDPAALAAALRAWLGDAQLRGRLRRAARERRESLSGWSTTASGLADVLTRPSG
jgi:glycosyltransferase involved in cell wall biosynthesis